MPVPGSTTRPSRPEVNDESQPEEIVAEFGRRLADLRWVKSLHVGGSLATGDHRAHVSDLDLVAVTAGPLIEHQRACLVSIHEAVPRTSKLGCTYVPAQMVGALAAAHTTWTHGKLIRRPLSGIARAELVRHGYAVFGREPREVWPSMSAED